MSDANDTTRVSVQLTGPELEHLAWIQEYTGHSGNAGAVRYLIAQDMHRQKAPRALSPIDTYRNHAPGPKEHL